MDGLELSPRKVAYLKFIFEKNGMVRTTDISGKFGVDPSTITKTLRELAGSGLILHEPYHGVSLTETGKRYAEFLVKRHRILVLAC